MLRGGILLFLYVFWNTQKFQHGIGVSPDSLKLSKTLKEEGVVAAFDQQCEESAKTKYLQNRVFVLCLKSAVQRSLLKDRF